MKKFIPVLMVTLLFGAVWADTYRIQVLDVKADANVDEAFVERLEASGFSYKTFVQNGRTKIRLGTFDSHVAALMQLHSVRCKVASDAFIVKDEVGVEAMTVESVPAELAVIQKGKAVEEAPKVVAVTQEMQPVTVEKTVQTEKAVEDPVAEQAPCVCICDKHALRKAEIATALSFYKNSPHYTFKPEAGWSE